MTIAVHTLKLVQMHVFLREDCVLCFSGSFLSGFLVEALHKDTHLIEPGGFLV